MPKLSEEVQERRRARILDAAEACFVRSGFHRATMQQICKEAGVSPGALYLYFKSKEDLIEGISQRDRAELLEQFSLAAERGDVVSGLAEVLRKCVVERSREKALLLIEMGAEATRNPRVAEAFAVCDRDIDARLAAMTQNAIDRGQIAPAIPVPDLVRLMSMIAGGMFWCAATDPAFDRAAMAPHVLEIVSAALRPTGAGAPLPFSADAPARTPEPVKA